MITQAVEANLDCKVCKSTFHPDKAYLEKLMLKCPHCGKALQKKRDRKRFFVYTCVNKCCPFYVRNLTLMSKDEKDDFDKNPYKYKLHYYYRVFDIKLDSLKEDASIPSAVDLSRIRNAKYVLGLVLTYHINYGLSTRQTASILWDMEWSSKTGHAKLFFSPLIAVYLINTLSFSVTQGDVYINCRLTLD